MSTDDRMPKDGVIPLPADAEAPGPPAEEAIGYCRPPKATRFRKGQSGNPRSRQQAQEPSSVVEILNAELGRIVTVNDRGKAKLATKLQVSLLSLMLEAAKGKLAAARLLFAQLKRLGLMQRPTERPSVYIRRIPSTILTGAEFEAWFPVTPDGKHWRQRTMREARLYLFHKDREARERAAGGDEDPLPYPQVPDGSQWSGPQLLPSTERGDRPASNNKRTPDGANNPFEPSIEEAFGPPKDDAVGYGRPPKATQFKKGQSGNPKGRPRRTAAAVSGKVADILRAFIDRRVSVREGDKVIEITLLQAVIRAFVAKAARGEPRAVSMLLAELAPLDPPPQDQPAGYMVFNRLSLTREEFDARWVRIAGGSMRPRTVEEAHAYLREIGRAAAPIDVAISGIEKEPMLIKIPEHLRKDRSR